MKTQNLKFYKSKLKGRITVPPSKSVAHRVIICASLAKGESTVGNIEFSDDIIATIGIMKALGADIQSEGNALHIKGIQNTSTEIEAFCNESGSTLRFCLPICAMFGSKTHFVGRGKLGQRPMTIFEDIWREQGLFYKDNSKASGSLDITTQGVLKAGDYSLRGDVSSQFISGLLFALPLADGDSTIALTTDLASKGYIDLTLQALSMAGIDINFDGKKFFIKGNSEYLPINACVEGDWSQSAFFDVANYIGAEIEITGLNKDAKQGDKVIVDYIDKLSKSSGTLVFSGEDCPDIMPVFAVACALREGKTVLTGLSRLKIKECDRLQAVYQELTKLGAKIERKDDDLIFTGVKSFKGGTSVSSHNDHRIAMMLAIASTACDNPIVIDDCSCMSKSYPRFLDDFKSLGGIFE